MIARELQFPDKNQCIVIDRNFDDQAAPGRLLVRNSVSYVSAGTELAMFTRSHRGFDEPDFGYAKYPFTPGYAAVGTVVAVGEGVHIFNPGERVSHTGFHATYVDVEETQCRLLPDNVNDCAGTFLYMARIAMTAPILAPVKFGENVVVVGAGVVGNLAAQLCRLAGARMVAVADIVPSRLAKALEVGADLVFNMAEKPLEQWAEDLGPMGAQLVIEAVGIPATIDACMKTVASDGRVVLLGSPRENMEFDPYFDIHRKAIHLIGAHGRGVSPEDDAWAKQYILELLGNGKLQVESLITQEMFFEEALSAYEGLRDQKDKYLGVILTYPGE